MNKILYLTIIREYYRQNAIFIFAVMMCAFGFLKGTEHIAIIKEALNSQLILGAFFLIWILYALKVTLFTLRRFSLKQSEFLYNLRLFPPHKRLLAFLWLQFNLIQLTFMYAVVMMGYAILQKNMWALLAIISVNILVIGVGALVYEQKIHKPNNQQNVTRSYFKLTFKTPQFLFFPRYLISNQPVLLFITKIFTGLLILGVCLLFPTDDYDIRLLSLAAIVIAFSQTVILQNIQFFEHQYFRIFKSLPISKQKWFLSYLLTLLIILLPEMLILARNWPTELSLIDFLLQFLLIISISCALLHYQIFLTKDNEQGFQILFFSAVGLALLIMFKIPTELLSLVFLVSSYIVLFNRFYKTEA